MARFGGVGILTCDGKTAEVATSTCAHCSAITEIPDPRRAQERIDFCRMCMKCICLRCYGKPCTPWMKRIERAEEAAYRRDQIRKIAG